MIVCDTGGLYAFLDTDDAHHQAARAVVEADPGPFLLSPFVLAELDSLVQRRLGSDAAIELLSDVDAGVYTLVGFSGDDLSQTVGRPAWATRGGAGAGLAREGSRSTLEEG